jgi:hypothetical protein
MRTQPAFHPTFHTCCINKCTWRWRGSLASLIRRVGSTWPQISLYLCLCLFLNPSCSQSSQGYLLMLDMRKWYIKKQVLVLGPTPGFPPLLASRHSPVCGLCWHRSWGWHTVSWPDLPLCLSSSSGKTRAPPPPSQQGRCWLHMPCALQASFMGFRWGRNLQPVPGYGNQWLDLRR